MREPGPFSPTGRDLVATLDEGAYLHFVYAGELLDDFRVNPCFTARYLNGRLPSFAAAAPLYAHSPLSAREAAQNDSDIS